MIMEIEIPDDIIEDLHRMADKRGFEFKAFVEGLVSGYIRQIRKMEKTMQKINMEDEISSDKNGR